MAGYHCKVNDTLVLLVMKFKQSQNINLTTFLDPYQRQLPGKCISLFKKLGLVNIFFQLPKMKSRELWGIFKLRLKITSRAFFGTKLKVWVQYEQWHKVHYEVLLRLMGVTRYKY